MIVEAFVKVHWLLEAGEEQHAAKYLACVTETIEEEGIAAETTEPGDEIFETKIGVCSSGLTARNHKTWVKHFNAKAGCLHCFRRWSVAIKRWFFSSISANNNEVSIPSLHHTHLTMIQGTHSELQDTIRTLREMRVVRAPLVIVSDAFRKSLKVESIKSPESIDLFDSRTLGL